MNKATLDVDIIKDNFKLYDNIFILEYYDHVQSSARNTKLFDSAVPKIPKDDKKITIVKDTDKKPEVEPTKEIVTNITVVNEDCIDAAVKYVNAKEKVVLLNMSNGKEAGGGYLRAEKTQEVALCRRTTLYLALSNMHKLDKQRKWSYPLKTYDTLYTPEIMIFRNVDYNLLCRGEYRIFNVITASAIDSPKLVKGHLSKADIKIYEQKIKNIFDCAAANKVTSIVLSAFGSGTFKNPPADVAAIFKSVIDKHFKNVFNNITFAITGPVENYNAYAKVFGAK